MALHAIRRHCRWLRYAAELDRALFGDAAAGVKRFRELQDLLGQLHDALVLADWIAREATSWEVHGKHARAAAARVVSERNQAVRLELAHDTPAEVEGLLRKALHLQPDDVYPAPGPLHLADLAPLATRDELRDLRDEAFTPQPVAAFVDADMFRVISEHDVLLHLPYESFDHVVDFVSTAAADPDVLAIKQTLYRTSADSPIVSALTRAAENGKQVTAMIELRARFDEKRNITWARVLEEAGVHVVYGVVGFKTHCKASLVVRREGDAIRRYVHLSTGNYNPLTARTYGDI